MTILITGGLGFLGSNLAAEAIRREESVVVLDNFSKSGATENSKWLSDIGKFALEKKDVRDPVAVEAVVKKCAPGLVFHLAGQVAMTTSIADPRLDFETNAVGTFNVLEAVRKHAPKAAVFYSSTNKVYGDLSQYKTVEEKTRYAVPSRPNGFDEGTPLEFHSPYGCSKGAADQYMLDYHRIYGLNTIVFRHSSMYGGRQFSTYDQGWVGWFASEAIRINGGKAKCTQIHGNGKQVRDLLYSDDMTRLYFGAAAKAERLAGQAFNIGGGMGNSMSLLELFSFLEKEIGTPIPYEVKAWRESDQKVFVADIAKIKKAIGWEPKVGKNEGLRRMIEWCGSQ